MSTTLTFTVTAGFLVRKLVADRITVEAWMAGLECSHQRAGRTLRFTVSGRHEGIQAFCATMDDLKDRLAVD